MKAKAKFQQAPDGSWFGTVEGTDDEIARFIEVLGKALSRKPKRVRKSK